MHDAGDLSSVDAQTKFPYKTVAMITCCKSLLFTFYVHFTGSLLVLYRKCVNVSSNVRIIRKIISFASGSL